VTFSSLTHYLCWSVKVIKLHYFTKTLGGFTHLGENKKIYVNFKNTGKNYDKSCKTTAVSFYLQQSAKTLIYQFTVLFYFTVFGTCIHSAFHAMVCCMIV